MLNKEFDDWAKTNIENYCDAVFDGQYYVMRENSRLTREKKNFLILSLNMGLKSWQSRVPEGYVVVPVKCTNNMAHAAKEVDGRLSAFKYGDVWKAMIEAVEK